MIQVCTLGTMQLWTPDPISRSAVAAELSW